MSIAGLHLESVTGMPGSADLRQRVLNATTFCTALASGLNFLADLWAGQPAIVRLMSGSALLVFGLLNLLGRLRGAAVAQARIFVLLALGYLGLVWWVLRDIQATPVVLAAILAGVIPMVLDGRERWMALAFLGLQTLAMAAWQAATPEFRPLLPPGAVRQDTVVTALLLGAGLAALVSLVMTSHQRERRRVEEAGERLRALNRDLEERNQQLDQALREIRTLEGIVPICSSCKKVRNDGGYFEAVEAYLARHSSARFSHTLCPDCLDHYFPGLPKPHA